MSKVKYSVVDLFAGVGGLSLGFERAGATVVAAVESNPHHADAYRSGHRHEVALFTSSIEDVSPTDILQRTNLTPGELDFLVGGPPCQPFSMAGKRHGTADDRGNLVWSFYLMVEELRPRAFVMENVVGLRSIHGGSLYEELLASFEDLEYECQTFVLDAADYGVPQNRKRLFVVGTPKAKGPLGPPPPTHASKENQTLLNRKLKRHRTVHDAIWDLPGARRRGVRSMLDDNELVQYNPGRPCAYQILMRGRETRVSGNGRTVHFPHIVERIRTAALPEGAIDPSTRYRRLYWDRPAYTLRAGSGSFTALRPIHPSQARVITIREAARLQSFPDFVQFSPIKKWAYQQIGNSVPPLLGEAIARHLIRALF